jgi:hypothetical protein
MGMFDDDFSHIAEYKVSYMTMKANIHKIVDGKEINLSFVESVFNNLDCKAGVNLIDLFLLQKYIEKNNIKKVTELGCGSTSIFLDKLSIARETFAVDQALITNTNQVEFTKCNIYHSADIINESCKTSDLILIDSQHSYSMAEFYHKNILINHKLPVFLHDFMAPGRKTYSEQTYWSKHLIDKLYKIYLVSDCFFHGQLYKVSDIIPPVSAIFEPIDI